jgi:DNA-binding transcriptional LysR family regulator
VGIGEEQHPMNGRFTTASLLASLRYAEAFLVLGDELNFSRAADRLEIAQQQLSKQIARLEELLGTQLVDRSTRHVRLTPAGEVAYGEFNLLLRRVNEARGLIDRASRGEVGRLIIGAGQYALLTALPKVLAEFGPRFPDVAITIERLDSREQLDALLRNDVDIAFPMRPPQRPSLEYETVANDRFVALVREDDPRSGPLPLEAFRNDRFIVFPPNLAPGLRALIDQMFRDAGFVPRESELTGQTVGLEALVAAGAGVIVGPAGNYIHPVPGVRLIELQLGTHAVLSMVFRSGPHPDIRRHFIDVVRTIRDREGWLMPFPVSHISPI